jgi:transposase InsO family protein
MVYIKQRWSASFQSIPPSLIIEESYLQTFLHTLKTKVECFISKHSTQSYHRRILFTDFSSYPRDQGFQYTSQAYFNLTKSYDITPSMSRRANPYDNAMAENFFSILKTECIYRHKPASFCEANEMIDRYIYFYNHERIQLKTGETPLTQRLST